ncbi:MAG: hypothetical protein M3066_14375 [Actinomycetota bacterium]|nr:hypothetical protein [Actinomycetota bacterium]
MPATDAARPAPAEPVDLDDPDAVRRAVALHRAGKAVLAVPFGAAGHGTLTWLDPRAEEPAAGVDGR